MITEDITRDVAEAQVTDDCRVQVWLRQRRKATLTPTQARSLAAELDRAAGEAERAADELRHEHDPAGFDVLTLELHVHPECVAGKCDNCDGQTLTITDEWVPCAHHCHERTAA